jgi:hypothetical protein
MTAGFASATPGLVPRELRARVVDREPTSEKLLFRFHQTQEKTANGIKYLSLHFNPDGTEAMREEAFVNKDGLPYLYNYEQKQLGEHGKVEVRDGKVHFTYTSQKDGTVNTSDDLPENYVVGPTLFAFIVGHWDELMEGKTIPIKIGVPERQGIFSFKLVPVDISATSTRVSIRLQAASMIVAMFMEPVHMEFDSKTRRPISSFGHQFPKRRKGDGWGDLVAEALFD